jgi:hypothetical protein
METTTAASGLPIITSSSTTTTPLGVFIKSERKDVDETTEGFYQRLRDLDACNDDEEGHDDDDEEEEEEDDMESDEEPLDGGGEGVSKFEMWGCGEKPDVLQYALVCPPDELDKLIETHVVAMVQRWAHRANASAAEEYVKELMEIGKHPPMTPPADEPTTASTALATTTTTTTRLDSEILRRATEFKHALFSIAVSYSEYMRTVVEHGAGDPDKFSTVPMQAVRTFMTASSTVIREYGLMAMDTTPFIDCMTSIANAYGRGLRMYAQ